MLDAEQEWNQIKTGGYFCVAVKELRLDKPNKEIVRENNYGYDYKRFFSYFTLDEVKNYLQELGVEVVYENVASSGKTNWIQVIAKK